MSDVIESRGLAVPAPADLAALLDAQDYLADDGVATACFLALRMGRPLFLEGDAGVGKTELAKALAAAVGGPLIRLQCYEGIDAAQALYDWDYPRQLLHLRAAQAAGADGVAELEAGLYDRRFLLARPLLRALETSGPAPSVLLIDEIDRADDEFEAFLLEFLADFTISIPELGTVRAAVPPLVVLTSNRTREVHDALKRRCLYHWMPHPDFHREVAIIRRRLPEATERLVRDVARVTQRLRDPAAAGPGLLKPPGVAESIDWAAALVALGARGLDRERAARTLGALVKHREDHDEVRRRLDDLLAGAASATGADGNGAPAGGDPG
ncbi:AAA family ATPase [Marinitenerispora sediminis]|uniref:ATPase n=1 Tax=Marinitenerispora sediminis TaxID=1931232 RepID=A0A368T0Q7_9ACTN|nr:MoxR family ATPase [Marinitenerispora sediminis]RCV52989.1 ATPase [Marinitenerispora sediminis]RCV56682.1 ATPase [Marinitenerispora sediminis]RCV61674.1 ATPase [Marinitenerispora sediminis]